MVAYIATETTITVILNGKTRTIHVRTKQQRNEVIKALEIYKSSAQTAEDLLQLEVFLTPIKRIGLSTDNRLELDAEQKRLYLKGTETPIEPGLSDKILDFLDHGLSIEPLIKFWESCLRNPHFVAVTELFHFLEKNHLPITDDGAFLGYKKLNFVGGVDLPEEFGELFVDPTGTVRYLNGQAADMETAYKYLSFISEANNPMMKDVYSGRIKQKIGEVVSIDRVKFNEEERRNACGYGLHVGAFSYSFSGNVRVLVKVFPEDVIACNPNEEKLRTCKYQIVSFVDEQVEVKELLINLTKEQQDIANGVGSDDDIDSQNPFTAGDIIRAVGDEDNITEDTLYYVVDTDNFSVCVVDDNGEESWFDFELFEER